MGSHRLLCKEQTGQVRVEAGRLIRRQITHDHSQGLAASWENQQTVPTEQGRGQLTAFKEGWERDA